MTLLWLDVSVMMRRVTVQYHVLLNVTRTKELVVDLSNTKAQVNIVFNQGVNVDTVENYKYNNYKYTLKLTWCENFNAPYKKDQCHLYSLRQHWSLDICRSVLRSFFELLVATTIW